MNVAQCIVDARANGWQSKMLNTSAPVAEWYKLTRDDCPRVQVDVLKLTSHPFARARIVVDRREVAEIAKLDDVHALLVDDPNSAFVSYLEGGV